MKVLVIGANGQIGKQLVRLIQSSDNMKAKAMIRKQEQASFFEDLGAETILTDLEDDTNAIKNAMEDVEAVVFTAGSGPKTGPDKTMLIDLDGAVKAIKATELTGVKRFVMISSFDTTREAIQSATIDAPHFAPYVVAKHYADEKLRSTQLDYTIIHPGLLTNDKGSGKVKAASTVHRDEVPREDIADTIFACLADETTINKEFQVVQGDTPIADAVHSL